MTEIGGRETRTMIGTTDAVTLLRQELRRLEELLDQLHSGGDPEVVAELAARLRDHIDVTEGIVFPAIRGRAHGGVPLELLANGTQQHGDLLRLLDEPAGPGADGDGAAAMAGVLEEQLRRHLEYEEIGIIPAAEELLDDDTLLDLGRRMQQRKQVLGAQHELAQMIAIARAWLVRALAASAALGVLALAVGVARRAVRR